ncbi:MAG: alpha-L-fucosidase [Lentisphaeria bacterium]|nr:alpha-L-fucosidase [Lentisphaeria bacterium]
MQTAISTARQLEYQDWEFGLFLHYGIRSFYEGHRDWDGAKMEPEAFQPTEFDPGQWAAIAAQAGAKYMVLTAKHHDGFANWPSKHTDFSVGSSSWQGGEGDVVRDYVAACREHGIKPGLYYSPADCDSAIYDDSKAYDDYFIHQISEILEPHGTIDILWFDGCGSTGHTYDWPRICREIRRIQPDIQIFSMGDPNFRWVGNELGIAPIPCWNTVDRAPIAVDTTDNDVTSEPLWLPAECDCRMRLQNWFYEDADVDTVKSLDELMGLYYYSVGRGCNLLLNIGPDRRGLLPEPDAQRLLEFGEEIRRRFDQPLHGLDEWERVEDGWELVLPEPTLLDHVVIQETLTQGEHVRQWTLDANPNHQGMWINLARGENIGHKAIRRFPALAVRKLKLTIEAADGEADLRALNLFHVG